jgi:Cdc6-like AAA superfamily ATPase
MTSAHQRFMGIEEEEDVPPMSEAGRQHDSADFNREGFNSADLNTETEPLDAPKITEHSASTALGEPDLVSEKVLVAGSRKIHGNYDKISKLAIELGTKIMHVDNWILLNGGASERSSDDSIISVDHLVCIGAQKELEKSIKQKEVKERIEKERILTLHPEKSNQPLHDIGKVEILGTTGSLRRLGLVNKADVIITIEGTIGTKHIIEEGIEEKKPVLPIACTGGESAKGWKDFEEYILQTFGIEKQSKEYEMLTTSKGLESPSQLSDLVINIIKDKLEPHKVEGVSGTDKEFLPLLQDIPTEEDRLARRPFAKHLAIRLKNIYEQNQDHDKLGYIMRIRRRKRDNDRRQGAFMLHIHGQWGSGKTSLLKLLADELTNDKTEKGEQKKKNKKWVIVWFNAWEHERSGTPWWSLMNSVYNQSKRQVSFFRKLKLRLFENGWRARNGLSYRLLWPFVIIGSIIVILLITDTQGLVNATKTADALFNYIQNKFGLIIASSVAIVSGILALSTSLAPSSARAARQFIDTVEDPTRRLSSHFKNLRKWVGHPIVVFIDDLDRCQHGFTVELLERIQTLFKDVDVIYVVAADRRWIYTSYNKAYDPFRKLMYEPGRPLRFLFLEKIFQLSMNVPPVDPKVKEQFWKYLVSNKTMDANELANRLKTAAQAEEKKFEKLKTQHEVLEEVRVKNTGDDSDPIRESVKRGAAIVRLASLELEKDIERRLVPFSPLVDSNPRLMKRVVNAYTLALATEIGRGGQQIDDEYTGKLALQAILELRWPGLGEYLEQHRHLIKYIGNKTNDGKDFKTEIPNKVKSEIPKRICNLLEDSHVIDVVRGNAPNVYANLYL